jgi:hypothetical protein
MGLERDLERLDHRLEDLYTDYDFAVAAEGAANERAAWETSRDERAARSALRPRTGNVTVSPVTCPIEPRPVCDHCHGLGYVGRYHPDPQFDDRETCDVCEGQGYTPPLDEPDTNELTPAAVERPGVMTDSH